MVENFVDVTDLMGRYDDCPLFVHVGCDEAAESAFGGNVESVCRLIHQQQRGIARKRETHVGFLLLPHRHGAEFLGRVDLESLEMTAEIFGRETRIEAPVEFHELSDGDRRQREFLGDNKYIGDDGRLTFAGAFTLEKHAAGAGCQRSGYQIEQRRFARPVRPEQPDYAAASYFH